MAPDESSFRRVPSWVSVTQIFAPSKSAPTRFCPTRAAVTVQGIVEAGVTIETVPS
jgi:hypothetical protein